MYYAFLLVDIIIFTTNKKIALMIKRPLKVKAAKPPANPSPTFSPITCIVAKKKMGEERMKIPLAIFHIRLYCFAIKKIRTLIAIRRKRNPINEFIISSFQYKSEFWFLYVHFEGNIIQYDYILWKASDIL